MRKDNTIIKTKRQHYDQIEQTTLYSKRKDNTIVKVKRQRYSQSEKTTL
jgi:hypothetical protein